jgi:tetratricopeptide (TPR) repeat protein
MGSKQTMVTAPVAVMLWDRTVLSRQDPGAGGRSRWLLYAGLASSWLVLGALVAYERWPTSIGFALQGWTPWTYLLTQTTVIAHYARLVLLGSPLALDYDGWPMSRSVLGVLPYAIPLAALLALTIIGTIRRRPWAFPLVIVFAALAPSSSVLPLATEIVAERRMYVPLAALVILAVVAGFVLLKRLSAPASGRIAACAAVVVAIAMYGSMTYARNQDFWSAERIWRDTVAKRPDNPRARLNYGVQLADQGRLMEAVPELREAVRLRESSAPAHLNLGAMLCSLGQLDEGIFHLERALQLDSSYTQAYRNLGEAYGSLGNRARAARYFDLAVTDRPDDAFLLNRLGWLLATSPEPAVRNASKAVEIAERAVRVTSRQDPTSLDTLAAAYAEANRFEDAAAAAAEAITLAGRRGDRDLLGELTRRQALYSARQKYREPGR